MDVQDNDDEDCAMHDIHDNNSTEDHDCWSDLFEYRANNQVNLGCVCSACGHDGLSLLRSDNALAAEVQSLRSEIALLQQDRQREIARLQHELQEQEHSAQEEKRKADDVFIKVLLGPSGIHSLRLLLNNHDEWVVAMVATLQREYACSCLPSHPRPCAVRSPTSQVATGSSK